MVFSLIYVSKSNLNQFGDLAMPELQDIEARSKSNNGSSGVSGFLFYHDYQFLQILQGDFDQVNLIFDKLKNDPRHCDVRIIWYADSGDRAFDKWEMLESINFDSVNFKKLEIKPSVIKRFIPERGHLSAVGFNAMLDVSRQIIDGIRSLNKESFS